jgi:hypothetical protein
MVTAGPAWRPARAGRGLGGYPAERGPREGVRHGDRLPASWVQSRRVRARIAGGLVLVRALWRAQVRLDPWQPRFEIVGRRLVPVAEAFDSLWIEEGFGPLYRRIFLEAALPVRR